MAKLLGGLSISLDGGQCRQVHPTGLNTLLNCVVRREDDLTTSPSSTGHLSYKIEARPGLLVHFDVELPDDNFLRGLQGKSSAPLNSLLPLSLLYSFGRILFAQNESSQVLFLKSHSQNLWPGALRHAVVHQGILFWGSDDVIGRRRRVMERSQTKA